MTGPAFDRIVDALRARRESVSARLDALAARVGLLGADALAVVASGLYDILDELDAEGAR